MAFVELKNTTNASITVRSFDKDSITLPPYSKHMVDTKFLWNLPAGIKGPDNRQVKFAARPAPQMHATPHANPQVNPQATPLTAQRDRKPAATPAEEKKE